MHEEWATRLLHIEAQYCVELVDATHFCSLMGGSVGSVHVTLKMVDLGWVPCPHYKTIGNKREGMGSELDDIAI